MIEKRFGRWAVIAYAFTTDVFRDGKKIGTKRYWRCRCRCGTVRDIHTNTLTSGHSTSCGCAKADLHRKRLTTHGQHGTRTWNAWVSMRQQCLNQNHRSYHNYGGRGIRVCQRWLHSFENFLADMGTCPPGLTLDRCPDNDGNYEPGNCRWATHKQQANNRRKAVRRQ